VVKAVSTRKQHDQCNLALTVSSCLWPRCGLAMALLSRATRRSSMAWPVVCHTRPGTRPLRYTVSPGCAQVLHCSKHWALHACTDAHVSMDSCKRGKTCELLRANAPWQVRIQALIYVPSS